MVEDLSLEEVVGSFSLKLCPLVTLHFHYQVLTKNTLLKLFCKFHHFKLGLAVCVGSVIFQKLLYILDELNRFLNNQDVTLFGL